MKIPASRINPFLRQPDPKVAAVLLFGPDQGLVRERAEALVLTVVDDLADPFRVAVFTGADIKADPPCLADEAAQLSLTGGRRVIWVHEATDGISPTFESFLDNGGHDNLVIVEAGTLGPQSSLRKLFEKSSHGASIGCYEDDAKGLEAVIRETLGRHGLSPTAEARDYLVENLGSDRRVTRSELEKLALYALSGTANSDGGNGENRLVGLDDAMACIGDSAAMSLDSVAYCTASGDSRGLDRAFERALMEGTSPVGILRAVGRHLQRIHMALGLVDGGATFEKAMAGLRPPIIFKFKSEFQTQMKRWRMSRLSGALELVTEAEIDCKTTGFPAQAGCHRALIRIAQAARAR
ncbi:MAG: DNA polymerase III subunit delta [Proteobacteria bacterium]|nr:DNA polymerase III subunit delta [Pseudomonadota bacterium]